MKIDPTLLLLGILSVLALLTVALAFNLAINPNALVESALR